MKWSAGGLLLVALLAAHSDALTPSAAPGLNNGLPMDSTNPSLRLQTPPWRWIDDELPHSLPWVGDAMAIMKTPVDGDGLLKMEANVASSRSFRHSYKKSQKAIKAKREKAHQEFSRLRKRLAAAEAEARKQAHESMLMHPEEAARKHKEIVEKLTAYTPEVRDQSNIAAQSRIAAWQQAATDAAKELALRISGESAHQAHIKRAAAATAEAAKPYDMAIIRAQSNVKESLAKFRSAADAMNQLAAESRQLAQKARLQQHILGGMARARQLSLQAAQTMQKSMDMKPIVEKFQKDASDWNATISKIQVEEKAALAAASVAVSAYAAGTVAGT